MSNVIRTREYKPNSPNSAAHVFISYARDDEEHARQLASDLRELGYVVWLDVERLLPGDNWDTAIRRALYESSYCVVLLSPNAVQKGCYVTREINQAIGMSRGRLRDDRFCIPVRVAPVAVIDKYLARFHYIDLFADRAAGLEFLRASMPSHDKRQGQRAVFGTILLGAICPFGLMLIVLALRWYVARASVAFVLKGIGAWAGFTWVISLFIAGFVLTLVKNLASKRAAFLMALIISGCLFLFWLGATALA